MFVRSQRTAAFPRKHFDTCPLSDNQPRVNDKTNATHRVVIFERFDPADHDTTWTTSHHHRTVYAVSDVIASEATGRKSPTSDSVTDSVKEDQFSRTDQARHLETDRSTTEGDISGQSSATNEQAAASTVSADVDIQFNPSSNNALVPSVESSPVESILKVEKPLEGNVDLEGVDFSEGTRFATDLGTRLTDDTAVAESAGFLGSAEDNGNTTPADSSMGFEFIEQPNSMYVGGTLVKVESSVSKTGSAVQSIVEVTSKESSRNHSPSKGIYTNYLFY